MRSLSPHRSKQASWQPTAVDQTRMSRQVLMPHVVRITATCAASWIAYPCAWWRASTPTRSGIRLIRADASTVAPCIPACPEHAMYEVDDIANASGIRSYITAEHFGAFVDTTSGSPFGAINARQRSITTRPGIGVRRYLTLALALLRFIRNARWRARLVGAFPDGHSPSSAAATHRVSHNGTSNIGGGRSAQSKKE